MSVLNRGWGSKPPQDFPPYCAKVTVGYTVCAAVSLWEATFCQSLSHLYATLGVNQLFQMEPPLHLCHSLWLMHLCLSCELYDATKRMIPNPTGQSTQLRVLRRHSLKLQYNMNLITRSIHKQDTCQAQNFLNTLRYRGQPPERFLCLQTPIYSGGLHRPSFPWTDVFSIK